MKFRTDTSSTVMLGSTVHIRDLETKERETYTLTEPGDADIRNNSISIMSPIARALYGRQPGDEVEFEAPGGTILVKIEAVEQADELQLTGGG